jgi:hypothetical protein
MDASFSSDEEIQRSWLAMQEIEKKIDAIPFQIAHPQQFERARAMFKAEPRQPGWVLELTESLGLLERPAGNIGGCIGCYFIESATVWIMETLFKIVEHEKVGYMPRRTIKIYTDETETPWVYTNARLHPSTGEVLLQVVEYFRSDPVRETIILYGSLPGHSTTVAFRRHGSTISVVWADPHGRMQSGEIAAKVIQDFLDAHGPKEFTYIVERATCADGPQTLEVPRLEGSSKEPGGYCRAWTSLTLILTACTDGAHPDEIYAELTNAFGTNPTYTTNFIRTVTKNMAALMRDRLKMTPEECEFMICCEKETYCSPSKTVTLGGKEYIFDDECFHPRGYETAALGNHLFTSKNGMHWFEYGSNGSMIGLRISSPIQNPNWEQEFQTYMSRQNGASRLGVGPPISESWSCERGASDASKTSVYVVSCAVVDLVLAPISTLAEIKHFSVNAFERFGRGAGLTFRGLIAPDSVYTYARQGIQVQYLLDLDLAVPETPPPEIRAEYEALVSKFAGPPPGSWCCIC